MYSCLLVIHPCYPLQVMELLATDIWLMDSSQLCSMPAILKCFYSWRFFFICLFGEFSVSIFGWLVGFFVWLQHTEWLKQNKRKSQNIPIKFAAPMGLEDLGWICFSFFIFWKSCDCEGGSVDDSCCSFSYFFINSNCVIKVIIQSHVSNIKNTQLTCKNQMSKPTESCCWDSSYLLLKKISHLCICAINATVKLTGTDVFFSILHRLREDFLFCLFFLVLKSIAVFMIL